MSPTVLFLLLLAAVTAYVLLTVFPDATQRWVTRLRKARSAILTFVGISFILLFLSTGSFFFMLLGFVFAVMAFVEVIQANPRQQLKRRL